MSARNRRPWWLVTALAAGTAVGAAACVGPRPSSEPVEFSAPVFSGAAEPYPNWPVTPQRADEVILKVGLADMVVHADAGAGTTGAMKLVFELADGTRLPIKWKLIPSSGDSWNNSPRRECAAYEVQKLFLDPEDWVVPTTVARCLPFDEAPEGYPMTPNSPAPNCSLGLASVWLDDVTVPDELYSAARFREDPTYAYFMSNLNLLTYLIRHRDGRSGNFLVSEDPERPQVFAIDNGISFSGLMWNYTVWNWDVIRVPALRRESVDRLRRMRRADLDRLAVVDQLGLDARGMLVPVPFDEPWDPDAGTSVRADGIQSGLRRDEIDAIWERIQELLDDIDAGRVQTF